MLTIFFNRSNQNGTPRVNANVDSRRPKIFDGQSSGFDSLGCPAELGNAVHTFFRRKPSVPSKGHFGAGMEKLSKKYSADYYESQTAIGKVKPASLHKGAMPIFIDVVKVAVLVCNS